MSRIKGWTKQKPSSYFGKHWWKRKNEYTTDSTISIGRKPHKGDYIVFTPTQSLLFKTQKKALEFVYSYMRRNSHE